MPHGCGGGSSPFFSFKGSPERRAGEVGTVSLPPAITKFARNLAKQNLPIARAVVDHHVRRTEPVVHPAGLPGPSCSPTAIRDETAGKMWFVSSALECPLSAHAFRCVREVVAMPRRIRCDVLPGRAPIRSLAAQPVERRPAHIEPACQALPSSDPYPGLISEGAKKEEWAE